MIANLSNLRRLVADLPQGDQEAVSRIAAREARLTKPQGSLGRLEGLVRWLGCWQGRTLPRLDRVDVLVFAGNHGVTAQGVSAFPSEVTAQMVANFAQGGAAINQLAREAGAELRVVALSLIDVLDEESVAILENGYGEARILAHRVEHAAETLRWTQIHRY